MSDIAAQRRTLLAKADKARTKGRARRAIKLYRRALEGTPRDADIHRKLAPLLARRRRYRDDAWKSFAIACDDLCTRGFDARAAGLLREAVSLLPRQREAWERLGQLEADLGRVADARLTLLEGRRHFRGRGRRSDARRLLELSHRLEPWQPDVVFELSRLRHRCGDPEGAARLVQEFACARPEHARTAQRALFVLRPTPATLWAWLRAPKERTAGRGLAGSRTGRAGSRA